MKLKYFARLGASIVMLATTTTPLITTVNAEIVTEAKTVHVTKRKRISLVTNKVWTKRLAQAGYVFKLPNAGSGALIKLNNKAYSKKTLKKIVKQNTLFKVTRLATVGNGIVVFLRSQNGKYRGSTNYVVGIYNKNLRNPNLQSLIAAERKAMDTKDKELALTELEKAISIAATLTGKNKKMATASIKQLREFLDSNRQMSKTPVLMIGQ